MYHKTTITISVVVAVQAASSFLLLSNKKYYITNLSPVNPLHIQQTIQVLECKRRWGVCSGRETEHVNNCKLDATATTPTEELCINQYENTTTQYVQGPVDNVENNNYSTSSESNPRSMFGTKEYWDDVYLGRGDFPPDTYSWYTNWNEIQYYVKPYLLSSSSTSSVASSSSTTTNSVQPRMLIPGIGNDDLLIDMIRARCNQHYTIVVQDYSYHAIERQVDLLQSIGFTNYKVYTYNEINKETSDIPISEYNKNVNIDTTINTVASNTIELYYCDITKKLPLSWDQSFDIIIEKGLLDAVYLSDDININIQNSIHNMHRILRPNGILLSISSVIPNELRKVWFASNSLGLPIPTISNTITTCTTAISGRSILSEDILPTPKTLSPGIKQQQQWQHRWKWIRDGSVDQKKLEALYFKKCDSIVGLNILRCR